jgi:hypothetical protein
MVGIFLTMLKKGLAQTVFGFIRLHFYAEPSRIYADHVEVAQAKPAYFGRLSINFLRPVLPHLGTVLYHKSQKISPKIKVYGCKELFLKCQIRCVHLQLKVSI